MSSQRLRRMPVGLLLGLSLLIFAGAIWLVSLDRDDPSSSTEQGGGEVAAQAALPAGQVEMDEPSPATEETHEPESDPSADEVEAQLPVEPVEEDEVAPEGELPSIIGRVIDQFGEPVPGAQVEIPPSRRTDLADWKPQRGETDAEGRFRIPVREVSSYSDFVLIVDPPLPLGTTHFSVRFFWYDYSQFNQFMESEDGREFDAGELTVLEAASLSGRVLDQDNNPVAGAEVTFGAVRIPTGRQRHGMPLLRTTLWHTSPQVTTGDDGRFHFEGVEAGPNGLTVRAVNYFDASRTDLELVAGEHLEADIVIQRAPRLIVTVLDDAGEPLEGATVHLFRSSTPEIFRHIRSDQQAVTDVDGRVEFQDLRESRGVCVLAEHDAFELAFGGVNPQGREMHIELRLQPSATLTVRPVDADTGEPLYPREEPLTQYWWGTNVWVRVGSRPTTLHYHQLVTHHPDGTIEIEKALTGTHTVRISHPQYATWTREVTIAHGQRIDLGDAPLEPGTRYRVLVVDSEGEPIEGAQVSAVPTAADARLFPPQTTDSDGMVLTPPMGLYQTTIRASYPGYGSSGVTERNPGANAIVDVRLRLAQRGEVTGTLYGLDGTPVARQFISIGRVGQSGSIASTGTDEQGRFRFEGIPRGRFQFFVRQIDEYDWTIAISNDHTFELEAGGTTHEEVHLKRPHPTLAGRLLYHDGSVATNVRMELGRTSADSGPRREKVRTDTQGRFEFWGPYRFYRDSSFFVRVEVEADRVLTLRYPVPADAEFAEFDRGVEIGDLHLPDVDRSQRASLRFALAGDPTESVPVSVVVRSQFESFERELLATHDMILDDLPLGRVAVTVNDPGFPEARHHFEMSEPGSEATVTLASAPRSEVTFVIKFERNADIEPRAHWMISLRCADGSFTGPSMRRPSSLRSYTFTRVARGLTYVATIQLPGYQPQEIEFTPMQQEYTIEVKLLPE